MTGPVPLGHASRGFRHIRKLETQPMSVPVGRGLFPTNSGFSGLRRFLPGKQATGRGLARQTRSRYDFRIG